MNELSKLRKKMGKLERQYEQAENQPVRRVRIMKQAIRCEKRIAKLVGR